MRFGSFSALSWLFLCSCLIGFGQERLYEERAYQALDSFLATPSADGLIALEIFEDDLPASSNEDDLLARTILLCNLGYYQKEAGYYPKAINSYEKAWQFFENNALQDYDIIEFGLKPLGNLYTITGAYAAAERTIKNYFQLAEKRNQPSQVVAAAINLSALFQSTGRNQEAITITQSALSYPSLSTTQRIDLTNNLSANLISTDRLNEAEMVLCKLLANLDGSIRSKNVGNLYKNLALIDLKNGKLEAAEQHISRAELLISKDPSTTAREKAKLQLELAGVFTQKEAFAKGQLYLQKAFGILIETFDSEGQILPEQQQLYEEPTLIDVLDQQALLFTAMNQASQALEAYELAFDVGDLVRKQAILEQSKLVQQYNHRLRSERCLQLLMTLKDSLPKSAWVEKALYFSNRSKSIVFSEEKWRRQLASSPQARQQATLLADIHHKLIQEKEKGAMLNDQTLRFLENEKIRLTKALDTQITPQKKVLVLAELQQRLKKSKSTLVAYFLGEQNAYAIMVSPTSEDFILLGDSSSLVEKTQALIAYFDKASTIQNDVLAYQEAAFALYQQLALDRLETSNIILIPDSIVSFVPFEALVSNKTTSSNMAKLDYAVLTKNFSYHFSTSAFMEENTTETHYEKVLGFFPVFAQETQPLLFSEEEAAEISNLWPGTYYLREDAKKKTFLSQASEFDVLHLSTHAAAGTAYVPAQVRFADAILYEPELVQLNLENKLVVLSACETGVGLLQKGEGALSLARSFGVASAEHLVFSLWKVNDKATAQWMQLFYQHLKSDEPAKATQQAKLAYLDSEAIPAYRKSPYYWASFVHYGDAQFETGFWKKGYWIVLIVVLLSIVGLFFFKNGFIAKVFTRQRIQQDSPEAH